MNVGYIGLMMLVILYYAMSLPRSTVDVNWGRYNDIKNFLTDETSYYKKIYKRR